MNLQKGCRGSPRKRKQPKNSWRPDEKNGTKGAPAKSEFCAGPDGSNSGLPSRPASSRRASQPKPGARVIEDSRRLQPAGVTPRSEQCLDGSESDRAAHKSPTCCG